MNYNREIENFKGLFRLRRNPPSLARTAQQRCYQDPHLKTQNPPVSLREFP